MIATDDFVIEPQIEIQINDGIKLLGKYFRALWS